MAQAGYTPIQLYRTSTPAGTPSAGNLADGELALNTADEKLYFKNSSGTVKLLASSASSSGTVSSVAMTVPAFLSVSGSPITTNGTLAVTLSGTALPVANGGTGITSFGAGVATWLGTPSSANLAAAVTDETGTGALVFANTPTLVTPILGTPTSGTLTNCSGLPLSTGVTGTLPVGSGGTGATTLTGVLKGNGTSAFTASNVNLASEVTGTLPVANGGTGQTSYTNGQLLIGNTTGNTLTKSTLTAGAGIAITNGTGSITIASTITGGLVYLSAATASVSSLVDLETGFSATYDNYVVIANDVVLSGADQLIFRLKIGGSYINTATYYNCQTNTSSSTGTSYATITGSSLAGPYNCVVMVFSANSSAVKEASSSMTAATTTPAVYNHIYSHLNTNTGAITGIRFLCVGPTNINSGTFTLYGIAKS